jgi:hypothetical protein
MRPPTCSSSTCASLSEPLLARRRILAPVLAPSGTVERVASWMRAHPAQAVAAGATATVVVATLWPTGPPPRPPRRDAVALTLGGEPAFAGQGGPELAPHEGEPARATGVHVLSVPSDEGFWIGPGIDDRVWVRLRGRGESPFQVKAGQSLHFVGKVVRNSPGMVERMALSPAEGAAELRRLRFHITVLRTHVKLD